MLPYSDSTTPIRKRSTTPIGYLGYYGYVSSLASQAVQVSYTMPANPSTDVVQLTVVSVRLHRVFPRCWYRAPERLLLPPRSRRHTIYPSWPSGLGQPPRWDQGA